MDSPLMIVLVVIGVLLIVTGFIVNRKTTAKRSRQERLEEFFVDYDERMSKLKKN